MSRTSRTRDADYGRDERRPRMPEGSSLDSRVFIGGINAKNYSYREIDSWMSKYGKVLDISLADRHILVQFDRESEATKAIDREQGQTLRGSRFDIRFAHSSDGSMSRSELPPSRSPRNASYERDPRDISPHMDLVRERSLEERDRYYKERRPNSPTDYRNYDRSRNPIDDRSRNPIDDRSRNIIDDRQRMPVDERPRNPIDERPRSNIRQEYANNESLDQNRNVPTAAKIPVERPNFDAAIIVMSSDLLNYAETIETKFQRQVTLTTHIIVLKEEAHANACIDDLEKKGVLYAFIVNQLNEKHNSCTLRILHGTGQEHRNMLLSNALTFVARNYEDYQKQHKELKPAATKPNYDPSRMPPGFMAPDDKIIYQLHLLADSRMLTIDELNDVEEFIQKRIQVLAEAEGIVDKPRALTNTTANEMIQNNSSIRDDIQMMQPHHNQIQSKISNILKLPQSHIQNNIPAMESLQSNDQYNEGSSNLMQNTKVQQALDTLMQSKFRQNNLHEQVIDDGSSYSPMVNQPNVQYMNQPMNQAMNQPMNYPSMNVPSMNSGAMNSRAPIVPSMSMNMPQRPMQPNNYPYYQQQQQLQQQQQVPQTMYRQPRPQFQPTRPQYPGY